MKENIKSLIDGLFTLFFTLCGYGLIIYGAYLIYAPIGYILAGVVLILPSFHSVRESKEKP